MRAGGGEGRAGKELTSAEQQVFHRVQPTFRGPASQDGAVTADARGRDVCSAASSRKAASEELARCAWERCPQSHLCLHPQLFQKLEVPFADSTIP